MARVLPVGGIGAQITVEDVMRVAVFGQPVALDPAGSERVKRASPAPKSFQAEERPSPASLGDCTALSLPQTRAVVCIKLLQLVQGRSAVRLQVLEFLAAMLNTGVLPQLAASGLKDATVLHQLADACYGEGTAHGSSQPLAEALRAASAPDLLQLSGSERIVLESGAACSAGIGALALQGGRILLSLATAAAALSFEAIGAQVCAGVYLWAGSSTQPVAEPFQQHQHARGGQV